MFFIEDTEDVVALGCSLQNHGRQRLNDGWHLTLTGAAVWLVFADTLLCPLRS